MKVRYIIFGSLETKGGWKIRTMSDIILALHEFSYFDYVEDGFIEEALEDLFRKKTEFKDIREVAKILAAEYI